MSRLATLSGLQLAVPCNANQVWCNQLDIITISHFVCCRSDQAQQFGERNERERKRPTSGEESGQQAGCAGAGAHA